MALPRVLFLLTASDAFRHRHTRQKTESKARILTPADGAAYTHALSSTNRFCPTRCASEIVQPATTQELAEWIRANPDTNFTVKGGGHSYGCQSVPQDGGVLIHTERFNGQEVFKRPDGSAYVRAGAGLTFDQLIPRLAKMNYSMPHGECLTVGLGGWALNLGNHPELKNFDNKWGYDGKHFIKKITFVNYAGTIFTVDEKGMNLVELGKESMARWKYRQATTRVKGEALNLFTKDIAASGPVMKAFKIWGASLAIATEFEIELIPKSEPGFFQVTYGANDIFNDKDGRGAKLMKAIVDVVANAGPDPDLDCGIFYAGDYFQGTREGVIALKCTDWASERGDTVAKVAPPGYRKIETKKSGFAFWTLDSYGKGWVPMWHAEPLAKFQEINGAEKYRDFLRALDRGDASGPNPCDSCSSELMYMLEPSVVPNIMFDNFCSGRQSNQDACAAFVFRLKENFLDDNREIMYKQNLPSCSADPKWKSQVAEYGSFGWELGSTLKFTWDPKKKVQFWLSLGNSGKNNGAVCEAAKVQPVGATCQRHGITNDDLVQAELAKVKEKCPAFRSYSDFDNQNNLCSDYIYDVASPLSVTMVE